MFRFDQFAVGAPSTDPCIGDGTAERTWRCEFFVHDESEPVLTATLSISFDCQWRVVRAALHRPAGTTPTELSRFPWSHWIGVAKAGLEASFVPPKIVDGTEVRRVSGVALNGVFDAMEGRMSERRPGRRGRPDDFYAAVLARYDHLSHSSTTPMKDLHEELRASEGEYGFETVRGWVRRAKELRREGRIT